jgi:dolichol-phosphate mannosyltransferase
MKRAKNLKTSMTMTPLTDLAPTSLIIPTYKEADNLAPLCQQIEKIIPHFQAFELIIVDDHSQDGTVEFCQTHKDQYPFLKLITRTQERGLSSAVIAGFRAARYETLVCMDADLSHPPSMVPVLVNALQPPTDFVIGSRFITGGSVYDAWSAFRRLNALFARALARSIVCLKDPLSGFFALKKTMFEQAAPLNPIGYKIALELIIKGHCQHIKEIPIHFSQRENGYSKLTLKEQLNFLRHWLRLMLYKCRQPSR